MYPLITLLVILLLVLVYVIFRKPKPPAHNPHKARRPRPKPTEIAEIEIENPLDQNHDHALAYPQPHDDEAMDDEELQRALEQMSREDLAKLISETGDYPLFDGTIKHAYSLAFVDDQETCPKCNATTTQQYAEFIFASDNTTGVMLAPAGFFCDECPTVLVDEEMLHDASEEHDYRRVLGLQREDESMLLDTWNGEDAVYIGDSDENILFMLTPTEIQQAEEAEGLSSTTSKPKNLKQRNKIASKSRKQNRKKKHKK